MQPEYFRDSFFLQLPECSSEGWVSGLNQYIANVPYAKVYRGFESLSLRHNHVPSYSKSSHMSVSQVSDEVLYTGLIKMQELPEL